MKLTWHPPKIESAKVTFSWGNAEVDYAAEVHQGAYYLSGVKGIARPWTEITLARLDLATLVIENFRSSQDITAAFISACETIGDDFKDVIDNYQWGIGSNRQKLFRNLPTWNTITDSGDLRDSQRMTIATQFK